MLALDDNDNQGVRYEMLPCLIALSCMGGARKLIDRYGADTRFNVVWAWCDVPHRHLSGRSGGGWRGLCSCP